MAAYDRRAQPFIIVAALAPFVIAMIVDSTRENLFTFVDLASWAVFVIDYVVRNVIQRRYWHAFRRFVDTSDLTLWLWGDPEAQDFQLEAMRQWYAVNQWKIARGAWPEPIGE